MRNPIKWKALSKPHRLWHSRFTPLFLLIALGPPLAFAAQTNTLDCNEPASKPISFVHLRGHPFQAIATRDGCAIFVSAVGPPSSFSGGITVLRRAGGKVKQSRFIDADLLRSPQGALAMVLTHDGRLLIATTGDSVDFLDVERLTSKHGSPLLGQISDGPNAGSIYVNVTADDHFAFVSDERQHSITVINLANTRQKGFTQNSIVGRIPTGIAPIALTFSPDGRYLYTTSEEALRSWGWPTPCTPEIARAGLADLHPEGAVIVVDALKARTDPANSVLARVPAGCSPVRLALSPHGRLAYVTVRHNNKLAVFDTARLITDPAHALIAAVPVGTAPVGVAVVNGGKKVIVTNSNRFARGDEDWQPLTVIDTAKVSEGPAAVLGTIPAEGFPRELRVTSDGKTLLLTNFTSNTLEIIDLTRLPLQNKAAHRGL